MIPEHTRNVTHCHIIGGSRKGKSRLSEKLITDDIIDGIGTLTGDYHGPLAARVLEFCADRDIGIDDGRKIVIVDPSFPERVIGLDLFGVRPGDVSTQVSNLQMAILRAWNTQNPDQMPTFELVAGKLLRYCIERRVPITSAIHLLEYENTLLRNREGFAKWNMSRRDFEMLTTSTANRLNRFLSSTTIRRMIIAPALDIERAMAEDWHVIFNLRNSSYLSRPHAKLIGTMVLNDLFDIAMRRRAPKPYRVYLDEFQKFLTPEIAEMLDEVAKTGVILHLAHQHLGQLIKQPDVMASIFTNCRNRFVFGGLAMKDAMIVAQEMLLAEITSKQVKEQRKQRFTRYEKQTRITKTRRKGYCEEREIPTEPRYDDDGDLIDTPPRYREFYSPDTESETESEVFTPIQDFEMLDIEFQMPEKTMRAAEKLRFQKARHYWAQFDSPEVIGGEVPFLEDYCVSEEYVTEYTERVSPGTLSDLIDAYITSEERRYLYGQLTEPPIQRNPNDYACPA